MSEWWTYGLRDFLLFSPRVYWRLFELHNEAVWPLHVVALMLGAAIAVWLIRPRPWSGRVAISTLAVVWVWVAWSFLWNRYATINWAVGYMVPAFVAEALLLGWFGGVRGRLSWGAVGPFPTLIGIALFVYALVLHPFVPLLSGRPFQSAEVFGIAPDPTAIATLGMLLIVGRLMLVVPVMWGCASWATLYAIRAPEAWIPLSAVGLTMAAAGIAALRERETATSG
jgi:hypothetical protein